MTRRVLLATLALVACTSPRSTSGPSRAEGGSGAATDGPSAEGTSGGAGGAATGEREPCRWEGWYRTPRLPKGCTGLCIPDDPVARVPRLDWADKDWCTGCKYLLTPWAKTVEEQKYAAAGPRGWGPIPDVIAAGINLPTGGMGAVFDAEGVPTAAWRGDTDRPCGRLFGLEFGGSGNLGIHLLQDVGDAQLFARAPRDQAAELMTSTENTFVWPAEFTRKRGINGMWFNDDLTAADFSGSVGIGDLATGKAVEINAATTGLPGGYNNVQLVGKTAFVSHFVAATYRTEWLFWDGGSTRHFLGDETRDVSFIVTDGVTLIWKEGTDFVDQPGQIRSRLFRRYDLYQSPYTSDPARLQRKLLLPDIPGGYSWPVLQNGYLSGIYTVVFVPSLTGAIVVRLSDGRAWRSILPGGYSWNIPLFPSGTELWGGVTAGPALLKSETIVRFPYEQMEVLQAASP